MVEAGGRGRLELGLLLVEGRYVDDGPELGAVPLLRSEVALLRLPNAIVDVGPISAALDLDGDLGPEHAWGELLQDLDVRIRPQDNGDLSASSVYQSDEPVRSVDHGVPHNGEDKFLNPSHSPGGGVYLANRVS